MKTERCATIAQFRGKIIMHPRLNEVIEDLRTFSRTLTDVGDYPKVILICGPAGVGKTTALKVEERAILESSAAEADNPAYLPSVEISVSKEAEACTTWKQFWAEGYEKSLIGKKPWAEIETKGLGEVSRQNTTEDLRQAVEKRFLHRHTKFLFIDEAQHLLCWGQDPSAKKNLEFLVSLATKFQVRCVMAGPYELKTLASLNGSLISRVRFIHFRAYGASKEEARRPKSQRAGRLDR